MLRKEQVKVDPLMTLGFTINYEECPAANSALIFHRNISINFTSYIACLCRHRGKNAVTCRHVSGGTTSLIQTMAADASLEAVTKRKVIPRMQVSWAGVPLTAA